VNDKAPKELHVRVTTSCFEKLQTIAHDQEMLIAAVCRQAIWQYIRQRPSDLSRNRR
jgi:hypothetical protein